MRSLILLTALLALAFEGGTTGTVLLRYAAEIMVLRVIVIVWGRVTLTEYWFIALFVPVTGCGTEVATVA